MPPRSEGVLWLKKKRAKPVRHKSRFIGRRKSIFILPQANLSDPDIFDRFSLDRFPDCFKEYADLLDWYQTWHTMLDTSDAPCWKWFVGGKINASYNCVDRHLDKHADKAAFLYVPEPE